MKSFWTSVSVEMVSSFAGDWSSIMIQPSERKGEVHGEAAKFGAVDGEAVVVRFQADGEFAFRLGDDVGGNGGFGYQSILQGADISILDSMILAHWLCSEAKEKKPTQVRY